MNSLIPEPLRRAWRLAWIALLLGVTGCGPGTGGTGTGPGHWLLLFTAVATPGTPTTPEPPGATCLAPCDAAQLRLEPLRVEFASPCHRFVRDGDWALDAAGAATWVGSLQELAAPGRGVTIGSLTLQFAGPDPAAGPVTVTLRDAAGRVLFGPLVLGPGEPGSLSPVAACPGA